MFGDFGCLALSVVDGQEAGLAPQLGQTLRVKRNHFRREHAHRRRIELLHQQIRQRLALKRRGCVRRRETRRRMRRRRRRRRRREKMRMKRIRRQPFYQNAGVKPGSAGVEALEYGATGKGKCFKFGLPTITTIQ